MNEMGKAINTFIIAMVSMAGSFVIARSMVYKLIDILKTSEFKRCYYCHKNDHPTFPVMIAEQRDEIYLRWICRRDFPEGTIETHAYTGMPIYMTGEQYPG